MLLLPSLADRITRHRTTASYLWIITYCKCIMYMWGILLSCQSSCHMVWMRTELPQTEKDLQPICIRRITSYCYWESYLFIRMGLACAREACTITHLKHGLTRAAHGAGRASSPVRWCSCPPWQRLHGWCQPPAERMEADVSTLSPAAPRCWCRRDVPEQPHREDKVPLTLQGCAASSQQTTQVGCGREQTLRESSCRGERVTFPVWYFKIKVKSTFWIREVLGSFRILYAAVQKHLEHFNVFVLM